MAKAVLKGAVGDYWHVIRYADTLNPLEKKTDSEVYNYGRAVGSVATDIVLAFAGATIVDKAMDLLKGSKVGQKIISLANQARNYFNDFTCQNKQVLANTLYDILDDSSDADVNGTVQLTRGKDSLRPLWSWLVANIQLQELTESDLKESLDAVPKWLHEYIVAGKYKLTTESLSIGMDVAIYLGEVFVHEFPQIYWGFFTKPKSRVSVNEPVLLGFENGLDMNPRRIVDTLMWQCANGKSSEGLYEVFEIWSKFVPAQPSKTN